MFDPATVGAQDPAPHVHLLEQGQQDPADSEQHRHQRGGRAAPHLHAQRDHQELLGGAR